MTASHRRMSAAELKDLGIQTLQLGPQDHISKCSAALRVLGALADDRRVGELIRLDPTDEWGKGEVSPSGRPGKRTPKARGLWRLSTEGLPSKSIEEHCQILLGALRSVEGEIGALIQDPLARVSIVICFYSDIGHGAFNLAAETVAELATFCEDLEVHFT